MIHPIERPTGLRSTNIRQAQQMSEVARRLMHIPRTAPVAYIIERDEQAHIEDEPIYSAIRNNKLISNLTWHQLTKEEQHDACNRMFDPNNCGW